MLWIIFYYRAWFSLWNCCFSKPIKFVDFKIWKNMSKHMYYMPPIVHVSWRNNTNISTFITIIYVEKTLIFYLAMVKDAYHNIKKQKKKNLMPHLLTQSFMHQYSFNTKSWEEKERAFVWKELELAVNFILFEFKWEIINTSMVKIQL